MNTRKVALSILAATAVGAVLGILFAPDKGTRTRSNLARKGQDFEDDVTGKYNDIVSDIKEKFDCLKTVTNDFLSISKDKINELKKEIS